MASDSLDIVEETSERLVLRERPNVGALIVLLVILPFLVIGFGLACTAAVFMLVETWGKGVGYTSFWAAATVVVVWAAVFVLRLVRLLVFLALPVERAIEHLGDGQLRFRWRIGPASSRWRMAPAGTRVVVRPFLAVYRWFRQWAYVIFLVPEAEGRRFAFGVMSLLLPLRFEAPAVGPVWGFATRDAAMARGEEIGAHIEGFISMKAPARDDRDGIRAEASEPSICTAQAVDAPVPWRGGRIVVKGAPAEALQEEDITVEYVVSGASRWAVRISVTEGRAHVGGGATGLVLLGDDCFLVTAWAEHLATATRHHRAHCLSRDGRHLWTLPLEIEHTVLRRPDGLRLLTGEARGVRVHQVEVETGHVLTEARIDLSDEEWERATERGARLVACRGEFMARGGGVGIVVTTQQGSTVTASFERDLAV